MPQVYFGENRYLGTYNQGLLQSKVDDLQLRNLESVVINDDSPFSDNYFNVVEFPDILTSGKNLLKLRANANTLVDMSRVYVEIIDYNGNPVYIEPISYRELDGTRVISIWIYLETPPGPCRVYVGGRARINPVTNQEYESSQDYNDPNYLNLPNVLWSRLTSCAPLQLNNTEIIYTKPPRVLVGETIIQYFQPIGLENIVNVLSGSQVNVAAGSLIPTPYGGSAAASRRIEINAWGGKAPIINNAQVDPITGDYDPNAPQTTVQANVAMQTIYMDDYVAWMQAYLGEFQDKVMPLGFLQKAENIFLTADGGSVGQVNQVSYNVTSYSRLSARGPNKDNTISDGWLEYDMEGGIVKLDNLATRHTGNRLLQSRVNMSATAKLGSDIAAIGGLKKHHAPTYRQCIAYFNAGGTGEHFLTNGQAGLDAGNGGTGNGPFGSWVQPGDGSAPLKMSGSAFFGIADIYNASTATCFHIGGYKLQDDTNQYGGGKFQYPVMQFIENAKAPANVSYKSIPQGKQLTTLLIDNISATSSFTCSWVPPWTTSIQTYSQSFAEIQFGDLSPATGDVHHVNIYYKPGGQIGEYIDAGRITLEQTDLSIDTGSIMATEVYSGVQPRPMGLFLTDTVFPRYFVTGSGNASSVYDGLAQGNFLPGAPEPEVQLTTAFSPLELMSAMTFTGSSEGNVFNNSNNRFAYFAYHPHAFGKLNLSAGTEYMVQLDAVVKAFHTSTDPNVPLPRLDIYASGSKARLYHNNLTINNYMTSDIGSIDPEDALYSNTALTSGGPFGHRIGTLELPDSGSYRKAKLAFKTEIDQNVQVFFVIRSGQWHVANIAVRTLTETGFTPNYARTFMKIPTQYYNTPMTFKVEYYDFQDTRAQVTSYIYPVYFTGENLVINSNNNVVSGSLFIGTSVGSGLQLSGEGSGFIRSVGYNGFTSASAGSGSGFMMYSGSVLKRTADDYVGGGVGFEMVQHSGSFFRFATSASLRKPAGLEVVTPSFFFGDEGTGQFISGSHGKIEITSSNFHLQPDGDVIMQGRITAEAGGVIGGFSIDPTTISSSNNALILRGDSGQITASSIQLLNPDMTSAVGSSATYKIKRRNTSAYVIGNEIGRIDFLGETSSAAPNASGSAARIISRVTNVGKAVGNAGYLQADIALQTFKLAGTNIPNDTLIAGMGVGPQAAYPGVSISGSLVLNTDGAMAGLKEDNGNPDVIFKINAQNNVDATVPWMEVTNASHSLANNPFVHARDHTGIGALNAAAIKLYSGSNATTFIQSSKKGFSKFAGRVTMSGLHVSGVGPGEGFLYAQGIQILTNGVYGSGGNIFKVANDGKITTTNAFVNHITASKDISASGTVYGNKFQDAEGNLGIAGSLIHDGDTDTKITFTTDDINITVGNMNMVDFTEDTVSEVTFNEAGADLDFRIESDDDTKAFYIDAGINAVQLGSAATTHVTASGNISSSGTIIGDEVHTDLIRRNSSNSAKVKIKLEANKMDFHTDDSTFPTFRIQNSSSFFNSHITASGNISASGTVQVSDSGYFIGTQVPPALSILSARLRISSSNDIFYDSADDHVFFHDGTEIVHIRGDEAILEVEGDIDLDGNLDAAGNITASGNISASGVITTAELKGTALSGDNSGSLTISGSLTLRQNAAIPAVSSSALYAKSGSFKGTNISELQFGGMPIGPYTTIMVNSGWVGGTTSKVWIPFAIGGLSDLAATTTTTEYGSIIVPFDGFVDQVLVRSENNCGDVVVGTHIQVDGTESPSVTAGESVTIDMSTDDTTRKFGFSSSFAAGNIVAISFDPASVSGDSIATLVLKYDMSKGL